MEKEEYKPDYEKEFSTYRKAGFAAFLAQSEETRGLVPDALKGLESDVKSLSRSEAALVGNLLKDGKGLEYILSTYPQMYKEAHDNLPLAKLLTNYDKIIAGYLDEETAGKLRGILGKFGSDSLKTIADKADEASWRVKGSEKGYSTEKLEDSILKQYKKDLGLYKEISDIVNYLEAIQYEEWKPEIVKKHNKEALKEKVDELLKAA